MSTPFVTTVKPDGQFEYAGGDDLLKRLYPQLNQLTHIFRALKAVNDTLGTLRGSLLNDDEYRERLFSADPRINSIMQEQEPRRSEWSRLRGFLRYVTPLADAAIADIDASCQQILQQPGLVPPGAPHIEYYGRASALRRVRSQFLSLGFSSTRKKSESWINDKWLASDHGAIEGALARTLKQAGSFELKHPDGSWVRPIHSGLPLEYQFFDPSLTRHADSPWTEVVQQLTAYEDVIEQLARLLGSSKPSCYYQRRSKARSQLEEVTEVTYADLPAYAELQVECITWCNDIMPKLRHLLEADGQSALEPTTLSPLMMHNLIGKRIIYDTVASLQHHAMTNNSMYGGLCVGRDLTNFVDRSASQFWQFMGQHLDNRSAAS